MLILRFELRTKVSRGDLAGVLDLLRTFESRLLVSTFKLEQLFMCFDWLASPRCCDWIVDRWLPSIGLLDWTVDLFSGIWKPDCMVDLWFSGKGKPDCTVDLWFTMACCVDWMVDRWFSSSIWPDCIVDLWFETTVCRAKISGDIEGWWLSFWFAVARLLVDLELIKTWRGFFETGFGLKSSRLGIDGETGGIARVLIWLGCCCCRGTWDLKMAFISNSFWGGICRLEL